MICFRARDISITAIRCIILLLAISSGLGADAFIEPLDYDEVSHADTVVPMVFPVYNGSFSRDSFLASRGGGSRRHHGQDLFGKKMQPLVAVFDGTVFYSRNRGISGNTLTIYGDNGWIANYRHINNDTPGTDDGRGSYRYAFSSGIRSGGRVKAGQLVAYLGDSGNAEGTAPHLHFELVDRGTGGIINPGPSLRFAKGCQNPFKKASVVIGPGDPSVLDGSMNIQSGEILLTGTARSVDIEKGEIVMDVSSVSIRDNEIISLDQKRVKSIRFYGNTVFRNLENAEVGLRAEDIQNAKSIVVIGKNFGVGYVLPARVIAITPVPDAFTPPIVAANGG